MSPIQRAALLTLIRLAPYLAGAAIIAGAWYGLTACSKVLGLRHES